MEITSVIRRRPAAPPSLRAQVVLVASAFLSGMVLAGLLFVGIWRHTATDAQQAHVGQAAAHRVAVAAQRKLALLSAQLRREHADVVTAQQRAATARRSLATEHAALSALGRTLPPRLAATEDATRVLVTKLSTLQSELAALASYIRQPGAAGLDAGYLTSQLHYLSTSVDAAASAAAVASDRSRAAVAAAAAVGKN
jgi:hypothetical protein